MVRFRVLLVLLALGVLAAAVSPERSPAAHHAKSKCQRLHGKKDLAPAGKVKVFRKKNAYGRSELKGCVLPSGKVRLIAATSEEETTTGDYRLRQVAYATVLFDTSSSSQYGSNDGTWVYDIKTNRTKQLASTCSEIVSGYCGPHQNDTTAQAAFVNKHRQAAAAIRSTDGRVHIVAYPWNGSSTELDAGSSSEIPPGSLSLSGSTVSWTHSGQTRSAQISG